MDSYKITNGRIILKNSILDGYDLIIEENIIADITQDQSKYKSYNTIDANRSYISPGFVEQHFHGCGTYGFDQLDGSGLTDIVGFLRARGINTFVPTFQWNEAVVNDVAGKIKASEWLQRYIPGIYIEGPFISKEKKGGISADYVRDPDLDLLQRIIQDTRGLLKLMTIAPEKEGAKGLFNYLNMHGIVPCFGHSNCEIKDVFITDQYKTSVTHLFNAMSPVSHQRSGLAMFPFINRNTFFEVNGDGVHVNDEALKMCYNNLNRDRLILTSDAVISAGLAYGEYSSYSRTIVSNEKGVRYKDNHVLMGSNQLVNDILKRFIKLTGAPLYEAVRFVSYNPCVLLGIESKRGSIDPGKEADLIFLDEDYNVVRNLYQ